MKLSELIQNKTIKKDTTKTDWSLIPWEPMEHVASVMTKACKKYERESWKREHNPEDIYFAALMRHVVAHRNGEVMDAEDNEPHLAHAICNLLFLLWHMDAEKEQIDLTKFWEARPNVKGSDFPLDKLEDKCPFHDLGYEFEKCTCLIGTRERDKDAESK